MRYTLFLLIFICTTTFAQEKTYSVDGIVKDKETKELLEFATVEVRNQSDSLILATITDSKGQFYFSLPKSIYSLKINFLGYNEQIIPVKVTDSNIYNGNIYVTPSMQNLESVTITAKSKRVDIDRDVHVVTREMKAGTASVKNLLENIRGISYDYIDNSISVNNKSNILLLVDGLKKNQDYIKNISPDRLKRVEVIRQPSGKYANEGYSAIINLILKRDYHGFEFYTEDRSVFSLDKSNGDDFLFSNTMDLNLTFTHKKINFYGMYNNRLGNTNLSKSIDIQLDGMRLESLPVYEAEPNYSMKNYSETATLGFDYFFNARHSISFESVYKTTPLSQNGSTESFKQTLWENDAIVSEHNSTIENNYSSKNYYNQLSYKGTFDKKNILSIDFAFNYLDNNQEFTSISDLDLLSDQTVISEKNLSSLAIGYKYVASQNISIELGYKNILKKFNTSSNLAQPTEYNDFRNKFYVYSSIKLSDKLSSKLGLNYEMNKTEVYGIWHRFHNVQPLLTLLYKANDKTSLKAKYLAKSKYPTDSQLSPYSISKDILSLEVGNLDLQSSNMNELSLEINLFNNSLSFEPYYYFDYNYISPTGAISEDENKYANSFDNMDKYETAGLNLSYRLSLLNKSLFWNFAASYWYEYISYKNHTNRMTDYSIKMNVMYRSKKYKTIAALLFKKENYKSIVSYGYESGGNDNLAVLLKQPLFKNRFDITMVYYLPVNMGFDYNMPSMVTNKSYHEYTNMNVSLLKNLFLLKLSYNFNTGKKVKHVSKTKYRENDALGKSIL